MAVRTCKVSRRDPQGVEHTVEVSAQSVFEAVAQALRVFREAGGRSPAEMTLKNRLRDLLSK